MKSICALLLGLLVASPALAQDPDKDALKRDLLKEVEKRLKSEEERLLKDIEKVIDEELNKSGKLRKSLAGDKVDYEPEMATKKLKRA